jgi:hypothetical protein
MFALTAITEKLQLKTTSTSEVHVVVSYNDFSATGTTKGVKLVKVTTATTTDICDAPAVDVARVIERITIKIYGGATNIVTVKYDISATDYEVTPDVPLETGEFLEYEEVYGGNFYGTLKSEIDRIWAEGKVVIFDVDVVGGLNLKKHFEEKALAIFVKPPSVETLAQRLKERSTETEETLQVRIGKAVLELAYENKFETVLLNENLTEALQKAEQLVNDFIAK